MGAPNPEVATAFEVLKPKLLGVEEVVGALKPKGDGSGAVLGAPPVAELLTPAPPFGVKDVKETIGLLLVVDPKGLPEVAVGTVAGAAALFMVELFVDEVLAELPRPKLNFGWVDVLFTAKLELT